MARELQFLRELHFIEAFTGEKTQADLAELQFLRELHFIEAQLRRPHQEALIVAVPSGTALH